MKKSFLREFFKDGVLVYLNRSHDNLKRSGQMLSLGLLILLIYSCQKSSMEDIKNAQICLNKATPEQAQACVSKIASDPSFQANQLKCSAHFIEQGYGDPSTLINIIRNTEGQGCGLGCSESVNVISSIAFSEITKAEAAFVVCRMSSTPVYTVLSSFAQIATKAKEIYKNLPSNGGNPDIGSDPEKYAEAILEIPNEDIGEIAVLTYENSCVHKTNGEDALSNYCIEISEALENFSNTDDIEDIGACLKYKLTGHGTPPQGCPLN